MKNTVAGQSFFVLFSSRRCYISIIKKTFCRFLKARLEVPTLFIVTTQIRMCKESPAVAVELHTFLVIWTFIVTQACTKLNSSDFYPIKRNLLGPFLNKPFSQQEWGRNLFPYLFRR